MESDGEKVMASLPSVGRVTKASRMPKRAKGVFIPLAVSTTPRRSPRLLAKRAKLMKSDRVVSAAVETSTSSITTPTRKAVIKKVSFA